MFINGLRAESFDLLYPFITNPGQLDPLSFGIVDLAVPNVVLAVLAGAAQYWQFKMLMSKRPAITTAGSKDENVMAMMNKQMQYFMPIVTVVIGVGLPGGLVLYWFVVTVLTALQQKIMFRKNHQSPPVIEGEKV